MELPAIVLAVVGALAGPAASIKVAAIQAGRTLDAIEKRLGKLEERIGAIERTEPEEVADMRDGLARLATDVATLRGALERLSAAHDRLVAEDEKRREKAAERAERRELREREQETALAARLATVHTLLETMRQEIRDARSR